MDRFSKDPGDTLDYGFKWERWLDTGVTVASSSWAATGGTNLTLQGEVIFDNGTRTRVVLSGGLEGERYTVTNTIGTAGGSVAQIKELSFLLVIEQS